MKSHKFITLSSVSVLAGAAASLFPLIFHARSFRQLYFFHDDWLMIDGADRLPIWQWLFQPFLGESVIPVFKLLWLVAVTVFGGGYFWLICLQWITHLVICILFGTLLARFHLPAAAIAFAVLTFGLAWSNIETLGWFMQWGSQLSLFFLLVAWHWLLEIQSGRRGIAGMMVLLFASGLSSSRGIISGVILALIALLEGMPRKSKTVLCAAALVPTVLMSLIMYWIMGSHAGAARLSSVLSYGLHYLLMNPLYHLMALPHQAVNTLAFWFYGVLKMAVVAGALWKAEALQRRLLLVLLALDVGNAAMLGFARSVTPLETAVSSRYQYISLLCFGPMAGVLVARMQRFARIAIFLLWIALLAYPWDRHAPRWAGWRGSEIRSRLGTVPNDVRIDPSGLAAGRARELAKLYHLH